MWLLDANMDVHLVQIPARYGIEAETADQREWKALANGELVAEAVANGFECLLTRDKQFGESARRALKTHRAFAVVVVNLPQERSGVYLKKFLALWAVSPIVPVPGQLTEWPPIGWGADFVGSG